jgi:hemoglobin
LLVLCGAARATAQSNTETSLYERLGRYDVIAAVVDGFMGRLLADPQLAPFFAGHSTDSRARVRQRMVEQVCAASGGPCIYTGRSMKAAHAGLAITEQHWQAAVGHLTAALEALKLPSRERADLLATLLGFKAEIVVASGSASAMPSLSFEALRGCLAKPQERGQCLDQLFREYLRTHPTADALAVVRRQEEADPGLRLVCRSVVHAIGRETFVVKRRAQEAFAACDQTCYSGCYHGVLERFIRGDATEEDAAHDQGGRQIGHAELKAKAAMACGAGAPAYRRFQCLHGLGHAVLFFSEHRLRDALEICDTLADEWSQRSCYGGVFMENLFAATPEKRSVSPTDFHYPCNQVDSKYRRECYVIQTWRMSEMGLSTDRLFEECRKAGANRLECMQSIGRDLSSDARTQNPGRAAEKCEFGQEDEARACIRGAVYALIDNTWDGRYALPFCTTLRNEDDMGYCFGLSATYLKTTFEKSTSEIKLECASRLTHPEACLEATEP